MDYLTVKELAELKGCSGQYIRKQIAIGAINADQVVNEANGHTSYLIPVSSLSEELQAKYYKQKRTETGLLPEQESDVVKPAKKPTIPQRSFEELSADERAEVNL